MFLTSLMWLIFFRYLLYRKSLIVSNFWLEVYTWSILNFIHLVSFACRLRISLGKDSHFLTFLSHTHTNIHTRETLVISRSLCSAWMKHVQPSSSTCQLTIFLLVFIFFCFCADPTLRNTTRQNVARSESEKQR